MAHFHMPRRIRFADTDPAGIVYFPRYFVMTNDLVEEWFADALDLPYRKIFEEGVRAVPLLNVAAKFPAFQKQRRSTHEYRRSSLSRRRMSCASSLSNSGDTVRGYKQCFTFFLQFW